MSKISLQNHLARLARSSLIGRRHELRALGELLQQHRTVTIVGPGGMGKTTLALSYLAERSNQSDVCWIDLSACHTLEDIFATAARTLDLGLVGASSDALAQQIGHALTARQFQLLVLDNFDFLVEHAPASVGVWLALAPAVRVLVTSRARLSLTGEALYELGPLPLPDDKKASDAPVSDAVSLFVARAQNVSPSFALTQETRRDTERLVKLLDGIPLAIELAAAQVRFLAPKQLLARMDQKLDLLEGGPQDVVERHQTLRSAIDGSWQSLDEDARMTLAQCSVFRGSFSLEAAEAIVPLSGRGLRVLRALGRLKDASLLRVVNTHDPAAPKRFAFYNSIHDYAREKLGELGLETETLVRHAHYFGDPTQVLGQE